MHGGVNLYRVHRPLRDIREGGSARGDDYCRPGFGPTAGGAIRGGGGGCARSWSLVAALHLFIAQACDGVGDGAAAQVNGWLAENATTRAGPRDRQVQVRSWRRSRRGSTHLRTGDLHLRINARVFTQGPVGCVEHGRGGDRTTSASS